MKKLTIYWISAIVITLVAAVYQRATGPTYPKREKVMLNGLEYRLKFIRSHGGETDAEITLNIPDSAITAGLFFRAFPSKPQDQWIKADFIRSGKDITAKLPHQPPAGKLEYYVEFNDPNNHLKLFENNPVVIRYKGDVPAFVLIPHVFFMFFAMLISNLAGILAAFKHVKFRFYGNLAFILLFLGGMILGPVVQKYAFGEFWTGVPFGFDLTDNKTLIGFAFWALAFAGNYKKERPYLTILAAIVLLLIYSIPHSMFGSELNRESGTVIQGFINFSGIMQW
jgi:hypothetical protein